MMNKKSILLFLFSILLFNLAGVVSAPLEQVGQSTIIEVGDELQILLKEDAEFQFRGLVEGSGNITLNYVGEIDAINYTLNEFKAHLKKKLLEDFYNEVTLSVSITKQAATDVFVYGAVQEPGAIQLPDSGRISIQQTLAAVKGLTTWADPEQSYILRANQSDSQTKEPIDIQATFNRVLKKNIVYLYAGDELYIPGLNQDDKNQLLTTAPREVIIVGQINAPGIQFFAPGEDATLMRAIFKAGGMTQFAQGNEVKLIRYRDNERTTQVVNINRVIEKGYLEEDVDLYSGDMIIVPQKFINF
jgi:protein involved in polysaccharide export with SLBB domain